MGQKIRPNLLRLGITENWRSRWWPKKHYGNELEEDLAIRNVIQEKMTLAGIVKIEIERSIDNTYKIFLKVARPGLVIGRGGKGIEELSKAIEAQLRALLKKRETPNKKISISLNVEELKRSEISAQYVAQQIAWDLEKRMGGRRVMKKHLEFMMQNREVQGAKIKLSGRIDGNEISRREMLSRGKLPLQTLRANIDYGQATSYNSYGTIGVKVWIYKGEVFEKKS
jgi:small subunit ribosomal protein S3